MVVRIFKTNQIYVYGLIPILMLLLRWPVLVDEAPFTPGGQLPFLTDFFAWLTNYRWLSLLLGIAAVTFQAFVITETVNEHRLLPHTSNLTAFVLVLSYSVFEPHAWFSPVVFANVFIVLALRRILDVYHQGAIRNFLFRAGIYISLASLLYLPSVFMILILFYDLAIIRTFQWREYVIPLIALLIPYFYFFLYYYLRSEGDIFFNYFIEPKTFLSILEFDFISWLPSMVMIILLFLSVLNLLSTVRKRTVRQNNLLKVIVLTASLTLLLAFIYAKDFMSATALLWISVCILLTYYILGIRKKWLQEGLVYLLLISIILRDFSSHFLDK